MSRSKFLGLGRLGPSARCCLTAPAWVFYAAASVSRERMYLP